MLASNSRIDPAAWRIAQRTLEQSHPDVVDRYGLDAIRRSALPRTVDDMDLGPDEAREGAARVVRAVFQAIRNEGARLQQAQSAEEVERDIVQSALRYLGAAASVTETDIVSDALAMAFATSPSLADGVLSAVMQPRVSGSAHTEQLERQLETHVVKVIDRDRQGNEVVSTGFVLCPDGHILTAAHVAGTVRSLQIGFRYRDKETDRECETRGEADVELLFPERDVAVLKAKDETWQEFTKHGLSPAHLAMCEPSSLRRRSVLCFGYKDPQIFLSPTWSAGIVSPHYPVRTVAFRDGHEQPCLVLLMPDGDADPQVRIVEGMSGGPVVDLEADPRQVVAMVTGATRRVFQRWHNRWEEIDSAVYGFAVPLSDIAECWPEFARCCLTASETSKGGVCQ